MEMNSSLLGKEIPFEEIKMMVNKSHFCYEDFGTYFDKNLKMSYGVKYAFLSGAIIIEDITSAVKRFSQKDFGDCKDKQNQLKRNIGCYQSHYGKTPDRGALMVQEKDEDLIIFFEFEKNMNEYYNVE